MTLRFAIQASNPRCMAIFDAEDKSLSDAIQTVFSMKTEYAILVWNGVFVPLNYKYDISLLSEDILSLVEQMLEVNAGVRTIEWPSNTFSAKWTIEWSGEGNTAVTAQWRSVLGDTEATLASRGGVVIATCDFLAEWKRLLETLHRALMLAGYTEALDGMARLKVLLDRIPRHGILYPECDPSTTG